MWQRMNQAWQDPVKGSWWKVLLLIGAYLVSQILVEWGLIQYGLAQSGIDSYDLVGADLSDLVYIHPWAFVILEAIALVVLILGVSIWGFKLFDWTLNKWKLLVGGFAIYGIMYCYLTIYDQVLIAYNPAFETTQNQAALQVSTQGAPFLLTFLSLAILGPIVEEILFRGLVMKYLLPQLPWLGLGISSVIFGLLHQPANALEWGLYAGMGLILGLTYLKTRRLEYAICVHIINNCVAVMMMHGL